MLRAFFALLALLMACPAFAQTTWRMATEYPASAMPGEGIATFARLVGERSGGRLVVQPSYDAAAGVKSGDMIAAVRDGNLEAGDAFGGALSGVDPVFALSSLPFVATSIGDAKRLAGLSRAAYEGVLQRHGQKLLYTTPWPPSGIWSKSPLASVSDLRALTIRTYDATSTAVMRAAGASAENLSFADAMPKLKDGAINAVLSSGDGGAGRRLWDFLPHFAEVNYAVPLSFATVSTKAYEALDPAMRGAVDAAAAETEARQWAAVRTRLDENYARMRTNGVTIRADVDPVVMEALRKAAETAVADWGRTAGPQAAAILDAYASK